jgi:S-adenosylmethionine synthetase
MDITVTKKIIVEEAQEFVERKGVGHPDTLSDALAEFLSTNYSNYTKEKYGAVLHHNFDKIGLLGGSSFVTFGDGYLINPIRVLLNGRASTKFGDEEIPVKKLLTRWSKSFFRDIFPMIDTENNLEFHYNLSKESSPGKTNEVGTKKATRKYWFEPRSLCDLSETEKLVSNDTSLGVGYYPLTRLESFVLKIEKTLNSPEFKESNTWVGSDIKIMGYRNNGDFSITLCVPQIANHVYSIEQYKLNLELIEKTIHKIASSSDILNLKLYINTRDNYDTLEVYLTATGSSIESGDEGLVGRGNRVNGLISPLKPMSMEGSCGKNPVYHVGKIYYLAAREISKKIYEEFGVANEVYLVSQSGRDLVDPWKASVFINESPTKQQSIKDFVEKEIRKIPQLTESLLRKEHVLF